MGILDWLNGTPGMPTGSGGGLLGSGDAADVNRWMILGSLLQDLGANLDHRQPTALAGMAQQIQKLGQRKQYQDMLAQQFAPGTPQVTLPQIDPSKVMSQGLAGATMSKGGASVEGRGQMRDIYGSQADSMLPVLQNLDPQQGLPVMLQGMQYAQQRNDTLSDKAAARQQDLRDNQIAMMTPEELAQWGYRPGTVAYKYVATGKPVISQESDVMSPEAMKQKQQIAAAGRDPANNSGMFSMIDTGDGMYGVTRGGAIVPMNGPDGKPLVSYHSDVGLRTNLAAGQSSGSASGTQAEAWPTTQANFGVIIDTLKKFDQPEFKDQAGKALGYGGYLPTLPGINSNFRALKEQLQGQVFLQAYNTLKGGGQITEIEGAKAEGAIARLNSAQTPTEFYAALADAKKTFSTMYEAARQRAARGAVTPRYQVPGPNQQSQPQPTSGGNVIDFNSLP